MTVNATSESDNTPLGDRMKRYEHTYRQYLPRRAYTLMRLDGRTFHTYLKNSRKPFDKDFVLQMDAVMLALCQEIQGVEFAYTQSDEISLLLTDFRSLNSELWFGGNVAKMMSVSASLASVVMDRLRQLEMAPQFDCRVWAMSDPVEVANYFVWRQWDAVTNSIQMLGQHYFTERQLRGRSCDHIQEMLYAQEGINWNNLDDGLKRGRVAMYCGMFPEDPTGLSDLSVEARQNWQVVDAPHFAAQPDNWLATVIPPLPTLWS